MESLNQILTHNLKRKYIKEYIKRKTRQERGVERRMTRQERGVERRPLCVHVHRSIAVTEEAFFTTFGE